MKLWTTDWKAYRSSQRPFLTGVARILDVGHVFIVFEEKGRPGFEIDHDALLQDWTAVGDNITWATTEYDASLPDETRQLALEKTSQLR